MTGPGMTARGFRAFPPRPGRRGRSWWAREFVAALEDAALDAGVLRRGRRFAGSGRLGPITVAPGQVSTTADDPDDGLVHTVVRLTPLTDDEWDRLLCQVAAEAGHLAALLDGEVPRTLVAAADAVGVALLPGVGDLESDCDCPDVGDPCPHSAALCYQTAWLLDDDPLVLLLLRGRSAEDLVDAVGADGGRIPAAAPADPLDRPVPGVDAYAATIPPVPRPGPDPRPGRPPVLPPAPGLPAEALTLLAAGAMERARALLARDVRRTGPAPTRQ